jgi:hypothetical protein
MMSFLGLVARNNEFKSVGHANLEDIADLLNSLHDIPIPRSEAAECWKHVVKYVGQEYNTSPNWHPRHMNRGSTKLSPPLPQPEAIIESGSETIVITDLKQSQESKLSLEVQLMESVMSEAEYDIKKSERDKYIQRKNYPSQRAIVNSVNHAKSSRYCKQTAHIALAMHQVLDLRLVIDSSCTKTKSLSLAQLRSFVKQEIGSKGEKTCALFQGIDDGFNSKSLDQRIDRFLKQICPELLTAKTTCTETFTDTHGDKKRREKTVFVGYRFLSNDEVLQNITHEKYIHERPALLKPKFLENSSESCFHGAYTVTQEQLQKQKSSEFESNVFYSHSLSESLLDRLINSDSTGSAAYSSEKRVQDFWDDIKRDNKCSERTPYSNHSTCEWQTNSVPPKCNSPPTYTKQDFEEAHAKYVRAAKHYGILKKDNGITAQTDISEGYEDYKNALSRFLHTREQRNTIAWAIGELTTDEIRLEKIRKKTVAEAKRTIRKHKKLGIPLSPNDLWLESMV